MIKILKDGAWALGGTKAVVVTAGEEVTFGPANDFELVEAGWAEWAKAEAESKPARKTKAE